jgi:chemotaxis protein MotB
MSTAHDDDDDAPRKKHEEHEAAHDEPWLVSYADLMTLLFGFFVLMYSFEAAKNQNKQDMVAIRKELSQFFGGGYVNPLDTVGKKFQETLKEAAKGDAAMADKLRNVMMKISPEGLEITFSSTALFAPGSSELEAEAQTLIKDFIQIIRETKEKYAVRVEGYTDPTPINSERFPSNWELSSARASTVIRMFEGSGFNPDRLTAVGFGSTRPMAPNRDAAGQWIPQNLSKNRRVVIYVTPELVEEQGQQ